MTSIDTTGMPPAACARLRQLRDSASLSDDSPWVVIAASPATPIAPHDQSPGALAEFLRREVMSWPAPIPIASDPAVPLGDGIAFTSSERSDAPGPRYCVQFHQDGSALVALAIGARREPALSEDPVWAVGEGAIAWIVIAALRLVATYADRSGAVGDILVEAAVTMPGGAPVEIWNHDRDGYGPAGHRLSVEQTAREPLDLADCLSANLVGAARPLIHGMLHPFGLAGDRHIDPSGALRRSAFTGFGDLILAWAEAIGIPSEP